MSEPVQSIEARIAALREEGGPPVQEESPEPQHQDGASGTEDDAGTSPSENPADQESSSPEEKEEELSTGAVDVSADEGTEEVPVTSFSDLAEYLEVEPDYFDDLQITVRADGEDQTVNLKDLRRSFQIDTAQSRKWNELDQRKKSLEAEKEKLRTDYGENVRYVQGLIGQLENAYTGTEENLARLKEEDPERYILAKQDILDRKSEVAKFKEELRQRTASMQEDYHREQADLIRKTLETEEAMLLDRLPQWREPTTRTRERNEIRTWMVDEGFTPEEIASTYDHRHITILRKAMLYDRAQKQVKSVKKRVIKAPKQVKQKPADSQKSKESREMAEARKVLRKSGKHQDAARAISILRRGS